MRTGTEILSNTDWQRVGRDLRLSPRELELVQQIFAGKKLRTIAEDMRLSLGTIKTYSQRIHHKLRVTDQRELTLAVFSVYLGS
ncbi:MAG TPA: LuxR C-terminal-related transcriptional regulator [Candidatus Polarisedimenticolia bacterium]|nr:LuxR C-terminal-related transcriptional regulator [Candidatus Polarisedimenticolia bacterium]